MSLLNDRIVSPGEQCSPGAARRVFRSRASVVARATRAAWGVLGLVVVCVMLSATPAGADITHQFLSGPSEALDEGVPVGCGCVLSGSFGTIDGLTVFGDRVWVGDREARIDGFEAGSPYKWVSPQLASENELSEIGDGLAVGDVGSEEQVYTPGYQSGKRVVAVYGASTGKLLGTWTGAHAINGSFTGAGVAKLAGVAVDRSSNPLSEGDVYVATFGLGETHAAYSIVSVFSGESGSGVEPALVATLKGTCKATGESCGGDPVPFVEPTKVAVSPVNGDVLVEARDPVTGHDVIDIFAPAALHEYEFVRQIAGPPRGLFEGVAGLAVDPVSGDIYVASTNPAAGEVYQFSSEGVPLGHVTGTGSRSFGELRGIGVASSGLVFVAEQVGEGVSAEHRVDVFGPDVVLPDVETEAAGATVDREGHIGVTFKGTVDPDDAGEARCVFVWGQTQAFGEAAACEHTVAEGNSPVGVSASVTGLAPDSNYWFRLHASNANGIDEGEEWQDREVHTPGPGLHREYVSDVSSTAVTFGAGIDPNHAPTSYYFQYTDTGSTGTCGLTPEGVSEGCSVAPGQPGETLPAGGGSDDEVTDHVQGLVADTTYHYRVVAISDLEVEPGVTRPVAFPGADRTFTTQQAGTGAVLPDGRAWELVTPPDKHGARLYPPNAHGGAPLLASADGDAMTFTFESPDERGVAGYTENTQALAVRSSGGGWSSRAIDTPDSAPAPGPLGDGTEYRFFSPSLSLALVEPFGPFTSLKPDVFPPDTGRTPYLRHDQTCASEPATCYEPLETAAEGYSDVIPGAEFNGAEETKHSVGNSVGAVNVVGASPNLEYAILDSKEGVQLTEVATPAGSQELYEWSANKPPAERLQLVSLDEENHPWVGEAYLGYANGSGTTARHDERGAVSADGSRVFWTGEEAGNPALFMRDVAKGVSLRLDKVQGGSGTGPVYSVFQGASANGTRVFFTDTQQLTSDSGAGNGKPDLYVCEMGETKGRLECALKDLTPKNEHGEAGDAQNVVAGFSENGEWVYFVANGVLPGTEGEGAKPGRCSVHSESGATCNLYVEHYDGSGWEPPRLVAVLSNDDYADWSGENNDLPTLTAGVSADGRWLAFVSDRELTGYDNHDARSGMPDEEVFLYHAVVGGAGRLVCASCDPTGARPEGFEYGPLAGESGLVSAAERTFRDSQWFAASLPGYDAYAPSNGWYRPRYLSDEGRLFFDSSAALVPQDTNNNQSVYEYEPVGVGGSAGCTRSLSIYVASAEGCVGLISSGTATGESVFVDASESGNDVFFETAARLTGQDSDNALDIYDAHVCTAESPCRSEQSASPACTTADACRAAPSVEPEVFGAPASTVVSGPGNLADESAATAPAPAPARTVKTQRRAQKLAAALKACRKFRAKGKRLACERSARARYGNGRKANVQQQGKRGGGRSGR